MGANVAAALGGLAILLGAFGLLNLVRGRRFWSLPEHVGNLELGLFLLVPAALPLIFGGQVGSAAATLAVNALILLLNYGVYILFALVLFINTEMWQVFSRMPDVFLALVAALLVGAGSLFVIVRLPR